MSLTYEQREAIRDARCAELTVPCIECCGSGMKPPDVIGQCEVCDGTGVALKQCDVCQEMKWDVENVHVSYAGDTSACGDCSESE